MSFTLVREKESELATTSLGFEYLHWKSQCIMLIGGDDISIMMSLTLAHDWWKFDSSVNGELQGNWRQNSNSSNIVASSPSFSRPAARAPGRACSQAKKWRKSIILDKKLHLMWTWCDCTLDWTETFCGIKYSVFMVATKMGWYDDSRGTYLPSMLILRSLWMPKTNICRKWWSKWRWWWLQWQR